MTGQTRLLVAGAAVLTAVMPLAIYSMMQENLDGALAMAVLLVALSGGVIVVVRMLTKREEKYDT